MKSFAQQTNYWCGPASLQYVAHTFGIALSQKKAADITNTLKTNGADPSGMIQGAKTLNLRVRTVSQDAPSVILQKLNRAVKRGDQVIVDYLSGPNIKNDGHYSVFKKAEGDTITLWDPTYAKNRTMKRQTFVDSWKDVTRGGHTFKRWAMIVGKPPESLSKK